MLALLFCGQGSQRHSMGRPWRDHPSWRVVGELSEAAGEDLGHLLCDAGDDDLRRTDRAQLATFALSMVVLDAIAPTARQAALVAGHSLGEHTAMVAARALGASDAARLVRARGQAMRAAAEGAQGTMAAIMGLETDAVLDVVEQVDGAWLANDNAPGQVVVAGRPEALTRAAELARAAGARRVVPLEVGGAFHTPLMAPALDEVHGALGALDWQDAAVPVVSGFDARPHRSRDELARLLADGMCAPVRWREVLDRLVASGATRLVAVGDHGVLAGLARRTLGRAVPVTSVTTPDDLADLPPDPNDGDGLHGPERMIVSPGAGRFEPDPTLAPGTAVAEGSVVGRVGDRTVRSSFAGVIAGVLAHPGERLLLRQPVAWLWAAT